MSATEWTDIYIVFKVSESLWKFLWNICRKLAWVEFGPITNEFRLDHLTDWAIKSWVQLVLRANFLKLLQFYLLFGVIPRFNYCLRQSRRFFQFKRCRGNHLIAVESPKKITIYPKTANQIKVVEAFDEKYFNLKSIGSPLKTLDSIWIIW